MSLLEDSQINRRLSVIRAQHMLIILTYVISREFTSFSAVEQFADERP